MIVLRSTLIMLTSLSPFSKNQNVFRHSKLSEKQRKRQNKTVLEKIDNTQQTKMAKKPRSQRRKKGKSMGGDEGDNGDNTTTSKVDSLSDSHTVADNLSIATFEEDYAFDDVDLDMDLQSHPDREAAESAQHLRYAKLQDALAIVDELPFEKRSARREGSLRKVFRALSQYATGEAGRVAVASRQDEIRKACFHGLRAGTAAEQYAACRVLEVTSVILGADQDEFYESIDKTLRRIIMTTKTRATPVRIAALRALSMANLIGASDQETAESLLDLCEEIAAETFRDETVPTTLRAAGLDCWSLLATTIPDFYLAGKDDVTMGRGLAILGLLKNCLETKCLELRSAAGECTALIHESRLNLGIDDDDGDNGSERRFRRGSWDGSEWEVLMDEVKQLIAELSVESGHHLSKKAKKEQRATFREFMNTIVDDELPSEEVNFRGGTIQLNSWREIVQINFVRHCLQGGFQVQLLTNETLQEIFGADGQMLSSLITMTQLEKRQLLSKGSQAAKAADKEMDRQRRTRASLKNHFLTADGYDINDT